MLTPAMTSVDGSGAFGGGGVGPPFGFPVPGSPPDGTIAGFGGSSGGAMEGAALAINSRNNSVPRYLITEFKAQGQCDIRRHRSRRFNAARANCRPSLGEGVANAMNVPRGKAITHIRNNRREMPYFEPFVEVARRDNGRCESSSR
jgi:hypothetical protein